MGKVLVVDDKKSPRSAVAMTLRKQGHEVDESCCIAEALDLIKKNKYELIVTDMRMPYKPDMKQEPEGGLRIISAAKGIDKYVAVIVITAYASTENAIECTRLGSASYLIKEFSKQELEMAVAMALEQRRIALENRKLMNKEAMSKELERSMEVQQSLLPKPPRIPEIDIAVVYRPLKWVSGDYYDFVEIDERQIGLALGDVSGKGAGAGMMMASFRASLRAQTRSTSCSVCELLSRLNKIVYEDASQLNYFVTVAYGIFDRKDYLFTYGLAGHPPILHYKAREGIVVHLDKGGFLLGLLEKAEFSAESIRLEKGDVLVLYSDGVIEACNSSDEQFGIEQLSKVIEQHGSESAEGLKQSIFVELAKYTGNKWEDDVTMMIVKVN